MNDTDKDVNDISKDVGNIDKSVRIFVTGCGKNQNIIIILTWIFKEYFCADF